MEYRAKRAGGRLRPLRVLQLRSGTSEAYKRFCVERGQREGQFKTIVLQYARALEFAFERFTIRAAHSDPKRPT